MDPILEEDLISEVAMIHDFSEKLIDCIDRNVTMIVPAGVYARHVSVLYLVIKCIESKIFDDAKRSGDYATWNRLKKWLEELNI